MKKWKLLLPLAVVLLFAGCGPVKEDVSLFYGEIYKIENEKLDKYDDLVWESSNESAAVVTKGRVSAVGPGDTVVTAMSGNKKVLEYSFSVQVVDATAIVLSTNQCEIEEGETFKLSYTLFPEDASDYGLRWNTASAGIAMVNDSGIITGISPGQTTISISNSAGFIATCSVTVKKAKPSLKQIYEELCDSKWASVAHDGSSLTIDTNPDDKKEYVDYVAYLALGMINERLGIPDSLMDRFGQTRALDGTQTQSFETVTVSWQYHPDKGLYVVYELN